MFLIKENEILVKVSFFTVVEEIYLHLELRCLWKVGMVSAVKYKEVK